VHPRAAKAMRLPSRATPVWRFRRGWRCGGDGVSGGERRERRRRRRHEEERKERWGSIGHDARWSDGKGFDCRLIPRT